MSRQLNRAIENYESAKQTLDFAKQDLAEAEQALLALLDVPEGESGTFDFGVVKVTVPVTYKVLDASIAMEQAPNGLGPALIQTKYEFSKSSFNSISKGVDLTDWFNTHIEARLGKPQIKVTPA